MWSQVEKFKKHCFTQRIHSLYYFFKPYKENILDEVEKVYNKKPKGLSIYWFLNKPLKRTNIYTAFTHYHKGLDLVLSHIQVIKNKTLSTSYIQVIKK